ncbi:MAG: putative signal transduction response regulator receiver and diguanylate cyclase [Planctomycetota bacterium]|nr:MAG: putative signal transduction response regulator receiver and diguanylate cyclase [Planctomycetota bacterium]
MNVQKLRLLLIEDNPADARYVKEILSDVHSTRTMVVCTDLAWAASLETGIEAIGRGGTDVVFLDLWLPDAQGMEGVKRVRSQYPDLPLVVLTGQTDEAVGLRALQEGAQEFLTKDEVERSTLVRAALYAIERSRMQAQTRDVSLTDELTGLFNRRGFVHMAEQQLRLIRRSGRPCSVVFADLDGLKRINDGFGHAEGDSAIVAAAGALRCVFRESDLLARIGGDEFTVLATGHGAEDAISVAMRIRAACDANNEAACRPWKLSLSIGVVRCDPSRPQSITDLLQEADRRMYEDKTGRRLP